MAFASSGVATSPLPTTGTSDLSLSILIMSQSALPEYPWLTVRGCSVIISTPSSSAILATSRNRNRSDSVTPALTFSVTGVLPPTAPVSVWNIWRVRSAS